jgi:hypothetical protein
MMQFPKSFVDYLLTAQMVVHFSSVENQVQKYRKNTARNLGRLRIRAAAC